MKFSEQSAPDSLFGKRVAGVWPLLLAPAGPSREGQLPVIEAVAIVTNVPEALQAAYEQARSY